MEPLFTHTKPFPGVYHIRDPLGVFFTLIIPGSGFQPLLFDAGYGLFDPRPYILNLLHAHKMDLGALIVVLSHAHHDHLPGARWFKTFYLHQKELPHLPVYTAERVLRGVLARVQGILPANFDEEAFVKAPYQDRVQTDLPDIPGVELIHTPGHTPGSLVLLVKEHGLILSGDNWNPTTWLFFPEALPVLEYAVHMGALLRRDFSHVLCSHAGELFPGERLRAYIRGLSPETFAQGEPASTPYPEIKTLCCHPEPGTSLVFRCFT
jgi:glyoxylase-like metal-dependent hydrolase (beta-lactamase superfamily II)